MRFAQVGSSWCGIGAGQAHRPIRAASRYAVKTHFPFPGRRGGRLPAATHRFGRPSIFRARLDENFRCRHPDNRNGQKANLSLSCFQLASIWLHFMIASCAMALLIATYGRRRQESECTHLTAGHRACCVKSSSRRNAQSPPAAPTSCSRLERRLWPPKRLSNRVLAVGRQIVGFRTRPMRRTLTALPMLPAGASHP